MGHIGKAKINEDFFTTFKFEGISDIVFIKSFNNKKLELEYISNGNFTVKINDKTIGEVTFIHELQNLITPLITHDDYEKIFH